MCFGRASANPFSSEMAMARSSWAALAPTPPTAWGLRHKTHVAGTEFGRRKTASQQGRWQPAAWFLARTVRTDKVGSSLLRTWAVVPSCELEWYPCTTDQWGCPWSCSAKEGTEREKGKKWDRSNISALLQHCQAQKSGTHSVNTYKLLRQGNIYC